MDKKLQEFSDAIRDIVENTVIIDQDDLKEYFDVFSKAIILMLYESGHRGKHTVIFEFTIPEK